MKARHYHIITVFLLLGYFMGLKAHACTFPESHPVDLEMTTSCHDQEGDSCCETALDDSTKKDTHQPCEDQCDAICCVLCAPISDISSLHNKTIPLVLEGPHFNYSKIYDNPVNSPVWNPPKYR